MTTETIPSSDSCDEFAGTVNQVTTDEARTRLTNTLFSALEAGENQLIDAPTSLGKSHTVATTPWREHPDVTGDSLVIHVHQTTEARDDAVEKSKDADGVSCHVLEGRDDSCPVAAGKHDADLTAPLGLAPSEWFEWMCDARNVPFGKAHSKLGDTCDLPCTTNGPCPSHEQWWSEVREKDGSPTVDVVHTTANFVRVGEFIEGANIIFDERPNYTLTIDETQRQQLRDSLSNVLEYRSGGDRAMCDVEMAMLRDNPTLKEELRPLLEEAVDPDWYFGYGETHRLAPAIGMAMLNAEETIDNPWTKTDVDLSGRWMGEHQGVRVVTNSSGKLRHVHHQPDLSEARCIIGLDAFPSEYRWRLNTVADLTRVDVLSAAERSWWRREERGLTVVQVGGDTRPYTTGWDGAGEDRAAGLIQLLRNKHGEAFRTCICASAIESDVRRMMEEVGIDTPDTMRYGGQNSLNRFEDELIGLLVGCIDPGDKNILDLLALGGLSAQAERVTTEDGDLTRKPGRSFDGPDADIANELLKSVRENNLAQAAGRYARKPGSSSSAAKVYVWSDACPENLTDDVLEASYGSMTTARTRLAEELRTEDYQTREQLQTATGLSKSYTNTSLNLFESHGVAKVRDGTGDNGAGKWWWCAGRVNGSLVKLE